MYLLKVDHIRPHSYALFQLSETMARLNVELDPRLLSEAVEVSAARSKREAIEIALREMVRRRRLSRIIERAGTVPLSWSVDDLIRAREDE